RRRSDRYSPPAGDWRYRAARVSELAGVWSYQCPRYGARRLRSEPMAAAAHPLHLRRHGRHRHMAGSAHAGLLGALFPAAPLALAPRSPLDRRSLAAAGLPGDGAGVDDDRDWPPALDYLPHHVGGTGVYNRAECPAVVLPLPGALRHTRG